MPAPPPVAETGHRASFLSAPAGPGREPSRLRVWTGRALALAIVAAIFGGALPHLVDFETVVHTLRTRVDAGELLLLAALTGLSVLASAVGLSAALPGLRTGAACVMNVVTTALSYALPGGGAAGAALNVTMARELGFGPRPITLQMLVTGAWNLGVRLVLPLLALGLLSLASDVPPGVRGAGVAGLLLAGALVAFLAVLVCCDGPARAVVAAAGRPLGRLRRGWRPDADGVALFRSGARSLIRSRWPALTISALGYHLATFGVLYVSLQAVGVPRVGVLEAFAVYATARQVTAVPLTPGSAGVLELALIGGLGLTGADLPAATAGVLLFRFFTYLLYLPAGGVLWLWWRWRRPVLAARPREVPFRHPGDAVRVVLGVAGLLLLVPVTRGLPGVEADLFRLLNDLPGAIEAPVWLVMQAGWAGAVGVAALAALLARRPRPAFDLALAGTLAWITAKLVKDVAGRPRPAALLDGVVLRSDAVAAGTGFVAGHTAVAAALVTVAGAHLPRTYRRALWLLVAAVGAARVYMGAHLPLDVVGGAALGWAIGAAVLLLHGTPGRRPRPGLVRAALRRHGVTVQTVAQAGGDLRRAVPFVVTTDTGRLFAKVVGRDQRDADLLHRLGRIWRRRPGEPPFATAKHQIEHEGYLLMRAARAGARVPRVRFITEAAPGDWLLAMEHVDGRTPDGAYDDALLDELWRQRALLAAGRIAHRDLRPDNLLVAGDGLPWIVGWGAAEADATDDLVAEDAARLLALTARSAGARRAVAAAVRSLGPAGAAALARHLADEPGELRRALPDPPVGGGEAPAGTRRRSALRALLAAPPSGPARARHPGDVVRLVAGLGAGLALSVFAAGGFLLPLEADVFRLVNDLPDRLFWPINVVMQAGSLGAVAAAAALALPLRRWRLAVDLAVGGTLAWLLAKVVKNAADRGRPGALLEEVVLRGAHEGGLGFVSGHAAVAAALATIAAAHVRRPVRWLLWAIAAGVAVGRMYVGAHFPLDVVAGAALGWAVGGAIHLLRGTPTHVPTAGRVAAALARCGLRRPVASPLKADARGSVPFTAVAEGSISSVFVKALGRDQRDADLLFKASRFLLYRELEDEAPWPSPKRQVEHEAYMLMRAADAGVRVPALIGVAPAGSGTWILAEEAVAGDGDLSGRAGERLDAAFLHELWTQIGVLHRAGIAHRDLRLANVLADAEGRPVLVDFGFAEDGASRRRLAQDVAELLTSTALVVGPRRAVRAAVDALGPAALDGVGELLQPLALARSTRTGLRRRAGLLDLLRAEVAGAGAAPVAPAPLSRAPTRPWTLLLIIVAGFATYYGLAEIPGVRDPLGVLADTGLRWFAVAALLVAASYVAGALALMGAFPGRLALGRTLLHQVAASYAARQHQAGQGSEAVLGRYLQQHGARPEQAVETLAVTRLAGGAVHLVALALALGSVVARGGAGLRPPAWSSPLLPVVGGVAAAGAVLLWRRRPEVVRPLRAAAQALPARLRGPRRLALLLGGDAAVTSCSVLAFLAVAHGMGVTLPAVTLAAVYLAVVPLRLLGPLPGGIGVVEPALLLALVALGAGPTEAFWTVLVFRVLSFWLPILPGAPAFHLTGRARGGAPDPPAGKSGSTPRTVTDGTKVPTERSGDRKG